MNERKLGIFLSYVAQAVQILSGLLYTPIMLRILGQSDYGIYQLVTSVISYLSLFSLGFNSSYVRFFTRCKKDNKSLALASLNGLFMTIFLGMSILCFFSGIIILTKLEFFFGNNFSVDEYKTMKILVFIMVLSMTLTFLNSVLECHVTARERFIFLNIINLLQKILNPFITLPCLLLGFGSIGIVAVSFILTLIKLLSNLFFCISRLEMRFNFKNMDADLLKEISSFTIFIFVNQIVDQINWNLGKLLLGRFCGAIEVAIYGVSLTVYTMYTNFANVIKTVFVPKINLLVVNENDNTVTDLFIKIGRIQLSLVILIFTGFSFFGKPFILMWAGKEYVEAYYITILLMASMIIPLSQCLGVEIQRAKNKHQMRTVVYFFIAMLNIIISIPLIKSFGALGAAMGTTIAILLGNVVFMNIYYHKRIGIDILEYWKSAGGFTKTLLVSVFSGYLICNGIQISGWISLGVSIFLYTLFYCLALWNLTLNDYEKKLMIGVVKKSIPH